MMVIANSWMTDNITLKIVQLSVQCIIVTMQPCIPKVLSCRITKYRVLWTNRIYQKQICVVSFHVHNALAPRTGVCEKKYHLFMVWSIKGSPAPQSCQSWSHRKLAVLRSRWYFFSHGLRVLDVLVPTLTGKGGGIPNYWSYYFWMVLFFANTGMVNVSA